MQLSQIKAGQIFIMRGITRKATSDAVRNGNVIEMKGLQGNAQMPSRWEPSDMVEWSDCEVELIN